MASASSRRAAPKAGHACQPDPKPLSNSLTRFRRQARIAEPADYQRVFSRCRFKVNNRYLTLLAVTNGLEFPRLGLAISRKVARTAIARNRIKRQIRESFRLHQVSLGALDIVAISRPGVARANNRELGPALEKLWNQLAKKCAAS